jgi:negative regulator of sigma E activity
MNDELYNLWKKRANSEAPADFADRVMDAVRREQMPSSKGVIFHLLTLPAVRFAACVLAFIACLCRMAAVFAIFLPE